MPIEYDPPTRTWLLSTPDASYAFRLVEDGRLRHLHWGARLTLEQAAVAAPVGSLLGTTLETTVDVDDELAAHGGPRFAVPSLRVRFADGTRAIEAEYVTYTIDGETLSIALTDRHYPLDIVLYYRVAGSMIERWVVLRHTAQHADTGADSDTGAPADAAGEAGPVTVERAGSGWWTLPRRDEYRLSHVTGHWVGENQLERIPVAHGETVFTSRRGVTSHQANPWVMLDAGDAGEEYGEVWGLALAWSGTWQIVITRTPTDEVGVTAGYGHDAVAWRLAPGQELRTPVVAGLWTDGGFGAASRAWHGYLRGLLPHPDELRPVLYNSWEATCFAVDEPSQLRLATRAADLGVELFVMDDGWFGGRLDDTAGLGDWYPNPERFPRGLSPLIHEVHRLGMRFGLWVEPEMVNPDSALYREHPDWVLHQPNRHRGELRNQLVLNLARPDVAAWTHGWLDRLLSEYGIDFLKWDMNRPWTEAGWPERTGDDPDGFWLEYVEHVYAVIDRLRADHPRLRIESCSGGGARVDPGILRRADQVWVSDNTDAFDRLAIQHGFSQVYPAAIMAAWVTDSPNAITGRGVPLPFRFHVAMAGVLGIGGNLSRWSPAECALAKDFIDQYKRVRAIVQHGRQYRLRPPGGPQPWAVQYVSADAEQIVVFCWLVARRLAHAVPPVRLRGLDQYARYRDVTSGAVYPGALLIYQGLPVDLPAGDYVSAMVHLQRVR